MGYSDYTNYSLDPVGRSRFFGLYSGIVKNNIDPLKSNKLQISVPQITGDDSLNWAEPSTSGSVSIPSIGDKVWVTFESGDTSYPVWISGADTGAVSYGAFSSYATQYSSTSNYPRAFWFEQTDASSGVSMQLNDSTLPAIHKPSRITFSNAGTYNIQFSVQFSNTDTADQDAYIWLRKNGTSASLTNPASYTTGNIPGSTGIVNIPSSHGGVDGHTVAGWNFVITAAAGDYYEFMWHASPMSTTKVSARYYLAAENNNTAVPSAKPETASVVLTITPVAGVVGSTGTGSGSGSVTSITASSPLTGGTITSSGTIGLDQTALSIDAGQITGTLPVANGGTGLTSFLTNQMLIGNISNGLSTIYASSAGDASTIVARTATGGIVATGNITTSASISASSGTVNGYNLSASNSLQLTGSSNGGIAYLYADPNVTIPSSGVGSNAFYLPKDGGTLIGTGQFDKYNFGNVNTGYAGFGTYYIMGRTYDGKTGLQGLVFNQYAGAHLYLGQPSTVNLKAKIWRYGDELDNNATWTTNGAALEFSSSTVTDTASTAGTTVAARVMSSFGIPTFTSTNSVTITNAATLYIEGGPSYTSPTSITNSYALLVNSGASRFGGNVSVDTLNIRSLTTAGVVTNNATTGLLSNVTTTTQYNVLTAGSGGAPTWSTINLSSSNAVSNQLQASNGGTGLASYVVGDLLYASGTSALSRLSGNTTTTRKFLSQTGDSTNSAAPSWLQVTANDVGLGTGASVQFAGLTVSSLNTIGIVTNSATGVLGTVGTTGTAGSVVLSAAPTISSPQINNPTITGGTISSPTISGAQLTGTTDVSGATLALGTAGQITANSTTITATELGYIDGLTSNAQTQISAKQDPSLYYEVLTTFSPGSPGTTAFSPLNLGVASGNGVTVNTATTYAIDMQIAMVGTGAATTKTLNFGFGANGTATITSAALNIITSINTTQITPAVATTATYMGNYYQTTGFSFALEPQRTLAATPSRMISIKGYVRIGGTAGSTVKIIPVLQYSTNGETAVSVYNGTYVSLTPVSTTNTNYNGTWS